MNNFSKFADIDAVVNKSSILLSDIEQRYRGCLKKQEIPADLLVDIKDFLSNLRTALDYIWHKIPNVCIENFPIANSEKDFTNKTRGIENKYVNILAKWQDYNVNSWIRQFSLFRNKNLHFTLVPQNRRETKEFSIKKNGTSIIARGCEFRGNISFGVGDTTVLINETTQFPIDVPGVDIRRIVWIDFLFDGSSISIDFPKNISALPFLKESFINICKIIQEIEQYLLLY